MRLVMFPICSAADDPIPLLSTIALFVSSIILLFDLPNIYHPWIQGCGGDDSIGVLGCECGCLCGPYRIIVVRYLLLLNISISDPVVEIVLSPTVTYLYRDGIEHIGISSGHLQRSSNYCTIA